MDNSVSPAEICIRNFAPTFIRLLPWCFRGGNRLSKEETRNGQADEARRGRSRGP